MKIALVGCTVNPRVGGMGRALYDHAVALSAAGHEVTVYSLDSIAPRDATLQNDTFTVGELRRLFSFGKAAWRARFFPSLDTFDIVHLHLPFFGVAEKVVDRPKSRLFMTYHMDAIGTGLKRIYFNWWYKHRFKKVLAAADAIAVTSRAYARESHLARAGIDIEKCEEILLRVNTDIFNPSVVQGHVHSEAFLGDARGLVSAASAEPERREQRQAGAAGAPELPVLRVDMSRTTPYLLFVGALDRAHYFKGVSVLLRALAQTHDIKLVIAGKGDLQTTYKKEAQELNIAERVHFTGGVTDEELSRLYAGARAEILPSTDGSEAFGIVLIEAMACGTPVIASDLPGVRTVVERVQGGVLVPVGIASSSGTSRNDNLVTALQNAWDNPWSEEDRAVLATRAAAVYGRFSLDKQLIFWYTHLRNSEKKD